MQKNTKKIVVHYDLIERSDNWKCRCCDCYREESNYFIVKPFWKSNLDLAPKLIFCVHCADKWGIISKDLYKQLMYKWGIWQEKPTEVSP
jgi:hypothetical protein